MPASTKVDKSPTPMDDFVESKAQPLWHVIVLNILTMSAYTIVWFWKTWRDLAQHANSIDMDVPADPVVLKLRNISPFLRTLGALIPGLQIVLTSLLFTRIAQLYPEKTSFAYKHPITVGILLTIALFGCLSLYRLPGPFMLLFLLCSAPFVLAQSWLNAYWKTQEPPNTLVRQAFTAGELASLILGAVLLGLIVTHFAIH
ncbi:MAG: DUF4234 domain-containing protein [Cyanobacteria bacterium SZAS-4]|nr:DUF4234 domain-containing protein [Cyanobacteria bacterium SZAS-4]